MGLEVDLKENSANLGSLELAVWVSKNFIPWLKRASEEREDCGLVVIRITHHVCDECNMPA